MPNKRSRGEVRNDKLQKVAADLFLKRGYRASLSTRSLRWLAVRRVRYIASSAGSVGYLSAASRTCAASRMSRLAKIDYTGLDLEASLKKLSFHILKLITAKRSVDLHRLAIGEAANCPEVGEAWYTHGPAKTASFIRSLLESRHKELRKTAIPIGRIAVILHDSLTGDILYRLLAGVGKQENDAELKRLAGASVDLINGNVLCD
jgi:hypothetical protein